MALVQHPSLDRHQLSTSARFNGQQSGRLLNSLTSRLNDVLDFPIHGSCSRCHHLHTNKALHLPLDPQQHTRFNCDNCDHPILGIGRTSTQTTLASIETNAAGQRSWLSEAEATSAQAHQPISVPLQSPPLRVDTSGNSGPLSTITEGVSPAQQSSAVLTPAVSGDLRSEVSSFHERPPTRQVPRNEKQETFEDSKTDKNGHVRTDNISTPSGGFWIRQSQRRLRERIRQHLRKPRSFNFSRLGLHVDVSPTPSAPGRPSLPVTSALPTSTWDPGNDPTSVSIANSEPIASWTSALSSPVRSNPVSLHSAESPQQPASAHPDLLIGRTWTLPEKHERIRALRREATLKRQAELISRCECQSECQCRNGSVQSNAASLGAEPSERSIQVPAHPLHRLLSETGGSNTSESSSSGVNGGSFLVGIGSHLPSEQVFPLVDWWTGQTPEYQQMFSDRVSQASTVCVRSNGSSVSLSSRRPASLRRSSTTPASVPRRSAEMFRSDLLEVTQNRYIPDPGHDPAPEGPLSPQESDSGESPRALVEANGLPSSR
ncbi:MAG: hypothetical protein Q9221_003709 [Calogaya cf. arnoldii]